MAQLDSLFEEVKESVDKRQWSRGVELARQAEFLLESPGEKEILLRVALSGQTVAPRVRLWPQEVDWSCDCGDKAEDPCVHVVAAVQAGRQGLWRQSQSFGHSAVSRHAGEVTYTWHRNGNILLLERQIDFGVESLPLTDSLAGYVAGMQSGRYQVQKMAATKTDFAIDHILKDQRGAVGDKRILAQLFPLLKHCRNMTLDGSPVEIGENKISTPRLAVYRRDDGYQILWQKGKVGTGEIFENGLQLNAGMISMAPPNQQSDLPILAGWLDRSLKTLEFYRFMCDVLPGLSKLIEVDWVDVEPPRMSVVSPRIEIRTQIIAEELHVDSEIVYGDPILARLNENEWTLENQKVWPIRNLLKEQSLKREVQQQLHLPLGRHMKFKGDQAAQLHAVIDKWKTGHSEANHPAFVRSKAEQPQDPYWHFSWALGETGDWNVDLVHSAIDGDESNVRRWPMEQVTTALGQGREYIFAVDRWFQLPRQWIQEHQQALDIILHAKQSQQMSEQQKILFAASAAEDLGLSFSRGVSKIMVQAMGDLSAWDIKLPPGLRADLRSYQSEGVKWLQWRQANHLGALLADDMGLGKTLQAICVFTQRSLVIAPTSVLQNWRDQLMKFRPNLKVCIFHGASRSMDKAANVVITSYQLLRQDLETFMAEEWDEIILDEAQNIKNPVSQVAKAAHQLVGRFRLALSGTPIENNWRELWSLFQFINPGLLGSYDQFQADLKSDSKQLLERRIRPFILRREKRIVAPDLPAKTESIIYFDLTPEEKEVYEALSVLASATVIERMKNKSSIMSLLESLLRLRQACCHCGLVPGHEGKQSSSKVEMLIEYMDTIVSEGHKALVFSQWTSFLDRIGSALEDIGLSYLRLDGSTQNRDKIVEQYQNDSDSQIMLLSLKAGGVGLNLTAADHVFIMDPWWNPAAEAQAQDRAHRIGQQNPVFIYKLVAANTIEERILQLQERKRDLAQLVLKDSDMASGLTQQDILDLIK